MYSIGGWLDYVRARPGASAGPTAKAIPKNVVFLGLTSLFTDISSEMVVSILPVYLVGFLRLTPVQFGIVDGLYQGVAGVMQLASALVADRWQRHKETAALGYIASALCRIGLLMSTAWTGIAAFLTIDRLGKGMRSAPRDALISLSVPKERLGLAFGVHRAMDAVGAMLGPLVAFAIIYAIPTGFDVVFVTSLCLAVIGVAVLITFVEPHHSRGDEPSTAVVTPAAVARLLGAPQFRHLALTALLLGTLTISDGFIYLTLGRRVDVPMGTFPLLYVATSAAYLVFAIPVGRIADRFGRFPVFLAGHAILLVLYGALAGAEGGRGLVVFVPLMLGVYYAATEGVLMALGSALLPDGLRTSGLALLTTALAVARFAGSGLFGLFWSRFGLQTVVSGYMAALLIAIAVVTMMRPREARA